MGFYRQTTGIKVAIFCSPNSVFFVGLKNGDVVFPVDVCVCDSIEVWGVPSGKQT